MDQLAESFQGLRPTSGSNSPVTSPTPPSCINQPPEGLESADSAEEGELRPSPVVRRRKMAAEQKGGDPRTGNTCCIKNKERTDESRSMANTKPTSSATRRASVEEIMQSPADDSNSTDRDPRNFMEIFPDSQEAFTQFMKGGPIPIDRARIWDKKLKDFIEFAAKMRQKPNHHRHVARSTYPQRS